MEKVLDCFSLLSDAHLLEKHALMELISTCIPLLCHPSIWIRHSVVGFLSSFSKSFAIDMNCIFYPMLSPFLLDRTSRFIINEVTLLENLKNPVLYYPLNF